MLGWETLTMAPIDRRLIVATMLSAEECAQLNAYHAQVRDVIGPLVEADVRTWLTEVTRPIS